MAYLLFTIVTVITVFGRISVLKVGILNFLLQSEEARKRDQEERAQLERNMRERDAAGTRKVHIIGIHLKIQCGVMHWQHT